MGQYDDALTIFQEIHAAQKTIEKHKTAGTLNRIGNVYLMKANYKDAVKCYQNALTVKNEYRQNHAEDATGIMYNLGLAFYKEGSYGKSLEQFQNCLAVKNSSGGYNEDEANTLSMMAKVHVKMGRYAEAIEIF